MEYPMKSYGMSYGTCYVNPKNILRVHMEYLMDYHMEFFGASHGISYGISYGIL